MTQFCKVCKKTKVESEFFRTISHTPPNWPGAPVYETKIFKMCNACSVKAVKWNKEKSRKLQLYRIALRDIGYCDFKEEDIELLFEDAKYMTKLLHHHGYGEVRNLIKEEHERMQLDYYNF